MICFTSAAHNTVIRDGHTAAIGLAHTHIHTHTYTPLSESDRSQRSWFTHLLTIIIENSMLRYQESPALCGSERTLIWTVHKVGIAIRVVNGQNRTHWQVIFVHQLCEVGPCQNGC